MVTEDWRPLTMSPKSKKEHLAVIAPRYKKASRKEKSKILDEFCANLKFNRKYAIRRIRAFLFPKPKTKSHTQGPRPRYNDPRILKPLQQIWLTANHPCSKRLKAMLPSWLSFYQPRFGRLDDFLVKKLLAISPATIDRVLKSFRSYHLGKGRSATKPGLLLKHQIPIQTDQWDESRPGFVEADTVAHCGDSLAGIFAYSLDITDLATGWTEQRASWGKGEAEVMVQIKDIEQALPFPLLGFDCDNGSEFLNHHLLRHFQSRPAPVQFTRSRPYHKNDNAHIEEKNWSKIRQWLGYQRFDVFEIVALLNDLYKNEWRIFHNLYLPSAKLIQKKRVGSKIIKIHDIPKTPFQRVLDSPAISNKIKSELKNLFADNDPFALRKIIDAKIAKIRRLARSPH
jgi:hypothetical protein